MIGFRSSSLTMIARIHTAALMASFCKSTIGTSSMTSRPSASVRIPESVGTNSSAKEAMMAGSFCQLAFLYSS